MLGWLIVLGVSLLVLVIFVIYGVKDDWCADAPFYLTFTSAVIIFVVLIIIAITPLAINRNIEKYKLMQEVVEVTYSEEDAELNFAMNIKVLEMNSWLAGAKASEETYGIFSFYKGKLDELEYIEIGDE